MAKVDADLGAQPQGRRASRGGFRRLLQGQYATAAEAEASGGATRTWVFKTDADGFAYCSGKYKASGDALYHPEQRRRVDPARHRRDRGDEGPARLQPRRRRGRRPPRGSASRSPLRGDFRLVKEVPITIYDDDGNPQEVERVLAEGVQFQLINDNEARWSPRRPARKSPRAESCARSPSMRTALRPPRRSSCPTGGPGPWPTGPTPSTKSFPTTWRRPSRPSMARICSQCPTGRRRYPPRASTMRPLS